MSTVTIEEAQANLTNLIHQLGLGQEMVITENDQPVAKLVGAQPSSRSRPQPGLAKGMITVVADDDEHLKDFAEYMP
jgi:antitoxin (DNA-binding transcriptional repressor) of toxin-antitoxin stability system